MVGASLMRHLEVFHNNAYILLPDEMSRLVDIARLSVDEGLGQPLNKGPGLLKLWLNDKIASVIDITPNGFSRTCAHFSICQPL